ncbi:MAG TPA: hypothetical protein VFZ34_29140 [Blastocatellia bacterium]|nr:hypothetical protein [Blastocatellia bacterium]
MPKPNQPENTPNDTRRTFVKGIVAGSVAGTLATTVTNAAPAQFAAAPNAAFFPKPRPETAKLKISFDHQKLPKLYDVQRAIEDILRRSGCPNCGLGGIDIILRLDELINPADRFVAVVEGEFLQR